MEIEMIAIDTRVSMRIVEEDQVSLPVSQHLGSRQVEKLYPPSPLPSAPTSSHEEHVEAVENSHHVITIPEPHSCRICEPDEDEQDDVLVELGCGCKGEMSSMHRKCILQWYGPRMLLHNKYKCEICKRFLHMDTIAVVIEAVSDHEDGGRAILMAALKKQLAPFVWMPDIESAADFDELVELLTATKAEPFYTLQILQIPQEGIVNDEIVADFRRSQRHLQCTWPLFFTFVAVAALVGGYAFRIEI